MDIKTLDKKIANFRKTEDEDKFKYGLCSEFAVAVKLFLNKKKEISMKTLTSGPGELYKHGLWHVCLFYNGKYCDIRGCHTERELLMLDPMAINQAGNRKAELDEVQHLYGLLDRKEVQRIIEKLKRC